MLNHYLVKAYSAAAPADVYRVLINGKTWPEWMDVESYHIESSDQHDTADGTAGVGDVRVFRKGRYVSHEPIVELIPDRRVTYTATNSAVRDYKASIELYPQPSGGTEIVWYGVFTTKLAGTGWLLQAYLRRIMLRAIVGLATYAGKKHSPTKPNQSKN